MSLYPYYTLFFVHIDPREIHLNLRDEGATEHEQRCVHREVFSFDSLPRNQVSDIHPPRRFRSFFQSLIKIKKKALETNISHYEVHMEESNTSCVACIMDQNKKESISDMSFPKHDWANIEEHLLTHGLLLTALTEWKEKRYTISRLQSLYEIIYRPDCEPYIRVSSPLMNRLPEVVAHAGVDIADALEISEEALLQKLGINPQYSVFG